MANSKFKIQKANRGGSRSATVPTIAQLLAVIAEYNRAHELDLAEHQNGSVPFVKNEFLEDLYFAAAGAARALRPVMAVELKTAAVTDAPLQGGGGKK